MRILRIADPADGGEPTVTPHPDLGVKEWMKNLPPLTDKPEIPGVTAAPGATPPPEPAKPASTPSPEPPKPGPTPPTPPPAPEDDETKWPRSAADWKKFKETRKQAEEALRKERDSIRVELEAVKAEIAKVKQTGPSPELENLRKERDQLDEALRQTAVENHPKFKAYYDGKINTAIAQAKMIVGAEKAPEIEKLLQQPDSDWRTTKLEELLVDVPPLRQGQFAAALNALDNLRAERQSEIDRGRENFKAVEAQRQADAIARATETERMVDSALEGIKGDASLTGLVTDDTLKLARAVSLGGTKDPKDFVKTVTLGLAYPNLVKAALADKEKIATLEKQLADLQAVQPGAGTPGPTGEPETPKPVPAGSRPQEAMKNWMQRLTSAGQ